MLGPRKFHQVRFRRGERALEDQYQSIVSRFVEARKDPVTLFLEMPTLRTVLGDIEGKSVIDFACGTGHYSRFLKALGTKMVLGVDLSLAMVEAARLEEKRNPFGVEYIVADAAEHQVFIAGGFDIATAIFLFNYADDVNTLEKMVSNVAANLKSGGKLIAVIPNPDFVNGLGDTLKYHFWLEEIEKRLQNLRVRMHFLAPEEFSIEFTQWDRLTYETMMEHCGFEKPSWVPFSVSPEGVAMYGEDYWAALLSNPKSVVVCARKSRSSPRRRKC
jgi:toxoflavin synthase